MRSENSLPDNHDVLEEAYLVWKSDFSVIEELSRSKTANQAVQDSLSFFSQCQYDIRQCVNISLLPELIAKRDAARDSLCQCIEEYLASCGNYHVEKLSKLEKAIADIEANYQEFLDTIVMCHNKSLNDLMKEYLEEKGKQLTFFENTCEKTDAALTEVLKILHNFSKALNPDCFSENSASVASECTDQNADRDGKRNEDFKAATLMDTVKKLHESITNEISSRKMQKSPVDRTLLASLVQCLLSELYLPVKGFKEHVQQYEMYSTIHVEFSNLKDAKPSILKLHEQRKGIKSIKSRLRHKLAFKKDIEESDEHNEDALLKISGELNSILHDLHVSFTEENELMKILVGACKNHFPEIQLLHSDLDIPTYSEYSGLLKQNWELDHFNVKHIPNMLEMTYESKFMDGPVVIKEYHIDSLETRELILQKLSKWHAVNDVHVLPVQAVFFHMNGRQAFVLFRHVPKVLHEGDNIVDQRIAYYILIDVLKGLESLHANGVVHSFVHPSTILLPEETSETSALLDFCFNVKKLNVKMDSKGIAFQPPECVLGVPSEASDMYSFGCLMLWLLLPNLHFHSTESGIPDIASFKNIIQNVLSPDGYVIISNLLEAKPSCRRTAKDLLNTDFLQQQALNCSIPLQISGESLTVEGETSLFTVESDIVKTDNDGPISPKTDNDGPISRAASSSESGDASKNLEMPFEECDDYYEKYCGLNDLREPLSNHCDYSEDYAPVVINLVSTLGSESNLDNTDVITSQENPSNS